MLPALGGGIEGRGARGAPADAVLDLTEEEFAQYGARYPERHSGFRDSLAWHLGESVVAAMDADELARLVDISVCGGDLRAPAIARWVRLLPERLVEWSPEFLVLRAAHSFGHEAMIRCLISTCTLRSLALFQAGRERPYDVVPFAIFRADAARCRQTCADRDGLTIRTEEAIAHWSVRLGCRRALCACAVHFADERGLGRLIERVGLPIHFSLSWQPAD